MSPKAVPCTGNIESQLPLWQHNKVKRAHEPEGSRNVNWNARRKCLYGRMKGRERYKSTNLVVGGLKEGQEGKEGRQCGCTIMKGRKEGRESFVGREEGGKMECKKGRKDDMQEREES